MFEASIEPSAAPAPTTVCKSSKVARIKLARGEDSVGVGVLEPLDQGFEITDVFFGPFDLYPDAAEIGLASHGSKLCQSVRAKTSSRKLGFRCEEFSETGLPVPRIFGSSESVSTAVRVVDYDAPASVRLSTQYV
jgi:hypothetical protein